jgi:hypothetical protein
LVVLPRGTAHGEYVRPKRALVLHVFTGSQLVSLPIEDQDLLPASGQAMNIRKSAAVRRNSGLKFTGYRPAFLLGNYAGAVGGELTHFALVRRGTSRLNRMVLPVIHTISHGVDALTRFQGDVKRVSVGIRTGLIMVIVSEATMPLFISICRD